jgi:hypothetical protein
MYSFDLMAFKGWRDGALKKGKKKKELIFFIFYFKLFSHLKNT